MMIDKHQALPTDRLLLYSASGFSQKAIRRAREERIVTVTAEPLSEDDLANSVFLHGLPAVWQKYVVLKPESARVGVLRSDGTVTWGKAPHDLALFLEDGLEFPFDLRQTVIMKLQADMPGLSNRPASAR